MSITYYAKNDPTYTVKAVLYLTNGHNAAFVRHFLEEHIPYTPVNPSLRIIEMGGPDNLTIVFHPYYTATILNIHPGDIAYVDDGGMFGALPYETFHDKFSDERPKEPAVPQPTETTDPSEYETHLTTVYDALAILRVTPREQDFEFAAEEIMELLAGAFNEGWSTGVEHAQVNPYAF